MKISVKTFLFGDQIGDLLIDGFHCIVKPYEYPENFKTFDDFKKACDAMLEQNAWDSEENIAIYRCIDMPDYVQTFELPSDDNLRKEYNQILAQYEGEE